MILYYILVQPIVTQQKHSLVRLSKLETTGLDNQFSEDIDRSVGTKNNLARQMAPTWDINKYRLKRLDLTNPEFDSNSYYFGYFRFHFHLLTKNLNA